MDLTDIRRIVITAVFADDVLMEKFVLKGGNALELVLELVTRGSVDIDLSMADDFEDPLDAERRLEHALRDRFDAAGHLVFDFKFSRVPLVAPSDKPIWWGGYRAEFKLISKEKHTALAGDIEAIRRDAQVIDTRQGRRFRIDISPHEFCEGKTEAEIEGFTIFVYTPAMCAIEKLRAICQQMREYGLESHPSPRARDLAPDPRCHRVNAISR